MQPIVVSEVKHKRMRSSWTLWANGITGAAAALLMTLDLTDALTALPTLKEYLKPELYQGLLILLTVANVLLRIYRTSAPILRKQGAQQ